MREEHCTCPLTPFADDPYYQCAFCERQQEEALREEERDMEEYRIFLESRPATDTAPFIPSGYFGPVPGVTMNQQIYCRVKKGDAWIFGRDEAVRRVMEFNGKGYPAKCDPPLTVTF